MTTRNPRTGLWSTRDHTTGADTHTTEAPGPYRGVRDERSRHVGVWRQLVRRLLGGAR